MGNRDFSTCIDHVGLAARDPGEAAEFHSETSGWCGLHRETNKEQGVMEAMIDTGAQGEENARTQLLIPLNESFTIAKWLDHNDDPGIQQLTYRMHDLDHVNAVLREYDLRLLFPETKRGIADSRINLVYPKDAGSVLLELMEPTKNASRRDLYGDAGGCPRVRRRYHAYSGVDSVPTRVEPGDNNDRCSY